MATPFQSVLEEYLEQFRARSRTSRGLHSLVIERKQGKQNTDGKPSWFRPFEENQFAKDSWIVRYMSGSTSTEPFFRAPKPSEGETEDRYFVKDGSGKVQAVWEPTRIRSSYVCGPETDIDSFRSLSSSLTAALVGKEHQFSSRFKSEYRDCFSVPRGGMRYVFGDVPEDQRPDVFMASAWNSGVLQFEHGVLIDQPMGESSPEWTHWIMFIHKLGWRHEHDIGLKSDRVCWKENVEAEYDYMLRGAYDFPDLSDISTDRFYSIIGSKDSPLDLYFASALALKAILNESNSGESIELEYFDRLKQLDPGKDDSAEFVDVVCSILSVVFSDLELMKQEQPLNEGRKRADICFYNKAVSGFFHELKSNHDIPCPYVWVECKNYSGTDPKNPEIDQLSGRLGTSRGKFGILVCRKIQDEKLLMQRCRDEWNENRNCIIYLADSDLLKFEELLQAGPGNQAIDEFLRAKLSKLLL